jgi:ATP-binding cassette subfamily B protein
MPTPVIATRVAIVTIVMASLLSCASWARAQTRIITRLPRYSEIYCGIDSLYVCCRSFPNFTGTLDELAAHVPLTRRGCRASDLVAAAEAFGIDVAPRRTSLQELKERRRPALLHVDGNHFIALVGAKGDQLTVFDNRIGLLECDSDSFSRAYRWQGVALLFGEGPPLLERLLRQYWAAPCVALGIIGHMSYLAVRRRRLQRGN